MYAPGRHRTHRKVDLVSTEVWFRNPDSYIRELVECGEYKIAWDRGLLVKKHLDPAKHASLFFGRTYPYRLLLVGEQGTAELDADHGMDNPKAVYPTWEYGEDEGLLQEILEFPVGDDGKVCSDKRVSADERPVLGQEHRVVISGVPNGKTGPGRRFLRHLKELQEDFPKAIIHVHGLYSWKLAFSPGFGAADVEPRTAAQKGKVHLPSGKEELYERVAAHPQWVTALGFKPVDLAVPRNRCMYNIKSAVWAGQHYTELFKFKVQGDSETDYTSSDADHVPETTKSHLSQPGKKKSEGDKFLCDTCSLQNQCKYFRSGAVCSLPEAEPVPLAKFFKTRDADTIIDGLGTLAATNTRRLERGLNIEQVDGELDPEVTKLMNQVFDQGVKLAKMLEPGRFTGGAKVQVNVGQGGAASISTGNPRQLVAAAIRQLESEGIPREKITTELIQGVFEGMQSPDSAQRSIQGTVTNVRDEIEK